jgi:hypothetical protein
MDEEERLDIIARMLALEYLLKRVFWMAALNRLELDGETDPETALLADLPKYAADAEDDLSRTTVRDANPAISDHVVALVSEHVTRFVDEIAQIIRRSNPDLR